MWRISLCLVLLMTMAAAADERMTQHLASLKKRLPGPGFRTTISAPFVVVGDLPADELEQYAQGTVGWASTRLKKLYFAKDPADIIDVWLFKDAPSYERNVLKLTGSAPSTPFGFYSPARAGLFMNIHTGGGTLVHELVHPYVRANFPDCPDWFNEGLASLYEQCGDHQGKIWGYTNWRLAGLQKAIRSRSLGSFQRMAELTEGKFYQDERGSNYGQARYLCLYLQEEGKLSDFYHRFSASAAHDPSGLKTLRSVLQVEDLVEFQKTWENWVLRLKFEP